MRTEDDTRSDTRNIPLAIMCVIARPIVALVMATIPKDAA
jgi:hypothetical protein